MSQRPRHAPDPARRRETSRRAILTATFELAGEVGYSGLSIEGIAARAGVGKQTIYRWWPSKGAVLLDALMLALQDETPRDGAAPQAAPQDGAAPQDDAALPDTGDLRADLKTVLRATVAELNDPRFDGPLRALAVEMLNDPVLASRYAEHVEEPMRRMKTARLRSAQRAGELPQDADLGLAVELLWGTLRAAWLERHRPLTPAYADLIVDTVLDGLRAGARR
ncbi:TetR/AcrR family transcriptional regulator [Streptomyces marincola]|uniref:TetR/AcrR family transcriptional regulator n=1 Tax=Streptomyces marincola TaxID=2878388 RepID=UPI001CF1EB9A|nr:TetR/AcrR family transcriptional regulator [Streptomyces marincola]UCM90014.1 TetR/AcrR family transcriptional regulator [Streptomyces marincola]